MISNREKLVNQLLSTVYVDKTDPTVIKVDIHNTFHILTSFGITVPGKAFEAKLEELLNKKLVGANITSAVNYAVVELIINLAERMRVSDEVKKLQKAIKDWRKEYYGSLPKEEKQAIIESMGNMLRPDVLDQIKKA
jgi:hypothetical protein